MSRRFGGARSDHPSATVVVVVEVLDVELVVESGTVVVLVVLVVLVVDDDVVLVVDDEDVVVVGGSATAHGELKTTGRYLSGRDHTSRNMLRALFEIVTTSGPNPSRHGSRWA